MGVRPVDIKVFQEICGRNCNKMKKNRFCKWVHQDVGKKIPRSKNMCAREREYWVVWPTLKPLINLVHCDCWEWLERADFNKRY